MKASIVFATGLMLAAGIVTGSINAAHAAGEAGAAGSISAEFSATGNNLTATAGAVAVGKSGAFTTSRGSAANISSVAVGYAGSLAVTGINDSQAAVGVGYTLTAESAAQLQVAQGNAFNAGSAPSLNLLPGTTTGVTIP
ncbi:hypothetical protein [Chamaesiphon sp. GL140_3_metabinner_50]|uniref:hypothetical protein n=1 Tax=Chamaesiphon sp. GL140_3_metabinner_50 TaxID=2970812 RepID=UPI0025E130B2|nr:hypothetical protein [Chamaesiphon sp. GL140_3_metabinner_50]